MKAENGVTGKTKVVKSMVYIEPKIKKKLTFKQIKVLNFLPITNYNVRKACRLARMTEENYYKLKRTHEPFILALAGLKEQIDDFVEARLFKNIKGGNVQAQMFYLKNTCPKYSAEITNGEDKDINITIQKY